MDIQTTNITPLGTWLSVTGCAVWVAGYNLWPLFGYAFYDLAIALTIMLLIWSIHLSAVGWHRRFSMGFLFIAMSNVVDEVFFDPTVFDINEYISAFIIFTTVIFESKITLFFNKLRSNATRNKNIS